MSIMSSFFRSRSRSSNNNNNIFDFDPLFLDEIWDPIIMFHDFPFPNSSSPLSRPAAGFSSTTTTTTENTGSSSSSGRFGKTRADWRETPEAHVFKIDLPGVKKDEVKVQVEEEKVLQISGERHREKEEKNDKWHHAERSSSSGKFMRKFRLPENAKVDQVKATMENGVLTVSVPKQQQSLINNNKPYVRIIEISG